MARVTNIAAAAALLAFLNVPSHADSEGYHLSAPFDDLTAAQKTAARRAAKTQPIQPLVVCAAPANMPLSNTKAEGIQNRIIKLLAEKMDTTVSFYWQRADNRGLMSSLFDYRNCNLTVGVSTGAGRLLETRPMYRTTYVFASRPNSGVQIDDLDDDELTTRSMGVVEPSAMRQALARHGVKSGLEILYQIDKAPWRLAERVADGKLDIAALWGPFAGYAKSQANGHLVLQAANRMSDKIPLEGTLAIGMRPGDAVLKYALDNALKHSAKQIKNILQDYDVPLVQCSECIVSGDIPGHGTYTKSLYKSPNARFLEPSDERQTGLDKDQARASIEAAIQQGNSPTEQLAGAAQSSEDQLVRLLVKQYDADPNAMNRLGSRPLGIAANNRDSEMIETLLDVGANPDLRDQHGFTPLLYAAHRNHMPSIKALANAGAELEKRGPNQMTPLGLATGERNFYAARALLKAGADVNAWSQATHLTPLMLVASKPKSASRYAKISGGMEPVDLARIMIERLDANVTAKTTAGVTALMIAAGQENAAMIGLLAQHGADLSATNQAGMTALDIAEDADADEAEQALRLFESMHSSAADKAGSDTP